MSFDEKARKLETPQRSREPAADDEPMGGDPACWLHLFEDEEDDDEPAPPAVS